MNTTECQIGNEIKGFNKPFFVEKVVTNFNQQAQHVKT